MHSTASPAMTTFHYCILVLTLGTVLSADSQVTLHPESMVVAVNKNFTFSCYSSNPLYHLIDDPEWLLNGSRLVNLTNVRAFFRSFAEMGKLEFIHMPLAYNSTTIQCVGTLEPRLPSEQSTSNEATLLVQGTLQAVDSFILSLAFSPEISTISLNWIAPFTLDIPDNDPDITYCVNISSTSSTTPLHSECGRDQTHFSYPVPPDSGCNDHVITVTPVNIVGRGEQTSLLYSQGISGYTLSLGVDRRVI